MKDSDWNQWGIRQTNKFRLREGTRLIAGGRVGQKNINHKTVSFKNQ